MKEIKNAIVHFEIPADDVNRAKEFYTEIFGWKIMEMNMPQDSSTKGNSYFVVHTSETDENGMIKHPGAINGGIMQRNHKDQPFTNYIAVESIDETLEKVKAGGGTVCMPKTQIAPGMGWIAAFNDTERNLIGLHESPKE